MFDMMQMPFSEKVHERNRYLVREVSCKQIKILGGEWNPELLIFNLILICLSIVGCSRHCEQ